MQRAPKHVVQVALLLVIVLLGCNTGPQASTTGQEQKSSPAFQIGLEPVLAAKQSKIYAAGPNGETPTAGSEVSLTEAELAQIRGMHATAAIVLHYSGNDWSNAQVAGLTAQFQRMGMKVIAVTDAGFKPEKQVSDLETVVIKKPNIIVTIPTDPVATAGAYRKVADRGIKLVFMDNVPKGLTVGKDYISVVSADNYGNGVAAAALMAQALGGKGNIGIVYHAADFSVTRERYVAFKKTITESFPNIHIIAEQGIGGPDFAGDAEKAASAMITSHRDINGIWAVWDVPAEGVIAAARTVGHDKLIITTCDLGENVAIDMARGGFVKGIGAQRPFDQGVVEALLAGYGLLNKKAPPYVVVPAVAVTRSNLLEAWKAVYHKDASAYLRNSLQRSGSAHP